MRYTSGFSATNASKEGRSTMMEADNSPADILARKACEKAARKQNVIAFSLSGKDDDIVITAVSSALSRAFSDPNFHDVPESKKAEAASRLAEQFLQGQRLVQALSSALNNPSTLAAQLKYNLREGEEMNIFDTIIDSTRPEHAQDEPLTTDGGAAVLQ